MNELTGDCDWLMTDGRTKAEVQVIGCYADREDDRDLPIVGPIYPDYRFCILHFCKPNVSLHTALPINVIVLALKSSAVVIIRRLSSVSRHHAVFTEK